ncbi:hypothetical protein ACHAXR_003645 [Thalassiosira sp. AJA248-18]
MFWKTDNGKCDNDVIRDDLNNENDIPIAENGIKSGSINPIGGTNEESTQQLHDVPILPLSSSPSKRAVQIMNMTPGLCADPFTFHSFIDVSSSWMIPSPNSLLVGFFQKCVICNGRLGSSAVVTHNNNGAAVMSSPEIISSSSGMLHCVACGVYAHRSCAFARPTTTPAGRNGGVNNPPLCQVNLIEIQKAFGMPEQKAKQAEVSQPTAAWSIFGKRSLMDSNKKVDSFLEEKKEPSVDDSKAKPIQQQPGMLETSIKLIQKTKETTKNIPTASAIGMVAGGAAGLAIAGPAGVIVGSQIGRNALAIGAVLEGGVGVSVLVMSLAAAANFSLPTSSASEKKRELKLNSTLILVRPDIAVDPVWGEYADEARKSWAEKNKESTHSSCGSFGLGHLFNSNSAYDERDMRYRKDSDIIKADSSELPTHEKVFLLANRILNDKMSLPGYVYRYLILKHKRRTMFGGEWSTDDAEKYSLRSSWFGDKRDAESVEDPPSRSSRQDAHGVIKHVTATLLEVRPGLASSPTMTELSASAVEVLVFGELYDDVLGEIIQQTEEKDDNLIAKVAELQKKCDFKCASVEVNNEGSTVSQSAIAALQSIPQAHTPTDKLLCCVEFLEFVSSHFSSLFRGKGIDADTLLIMVCQHVVAANINHLHAEVAFIEEFSRDEQLLSGKEGYALITLQASLHYLDSLDELPSELSPETHDSDCRDNKGGQT